MTLFTRFAAVCLLAAPSLVLAQAVPNAAVDVLGDAKATAATTTTSGKAAHERPGAHDASEHDKHAVGRGEKLYENLGYKAATPFLAADATPSVEQMHQLATAYRLNHDTKGAELWYGQLVGRSDEPLFRLYYAQALQSNGHADLAREHFDAYDAQVGGDDARGRKFANTLRTGVAQAPVTVRNETKVNGTHLDFSPSFIDAEHVVFVSTRPVKRLGQSVKDKWMEDNFMSLFVATADAETRLLGEPREFAPELNTSFHEGPVTFDITGERVFFTRNNYNRGKRRNDKDGTMRLNVYTSNRGADGWQTPTEMPWNTDEYEEAHPTLSVDGRSLYFASNRPGGAGGMDLYVSRLEEGTWGEPINLGKSVNTAGNEVFPFVHADGTLYFASNGLGGVGGMDIFAVETGAGDSEADVVRGTPVNIGAPYNSNKDDFGFIVSADGTYGYFTSARPGGSGGDDIYSFQTDSPVERARTQRICVYSAPDEALKLAGVKVRLEPIDLGNQKQTTGDRDLTLRLIEDDKPGEYRIAIQPQGGTRAWADRGALELTTDADGYVSVPMMRGQGYRVVVAHAAYEVKTEEVWATATGAGLGDYCVGLSPKPGVAKAGAGTAGTMSLAGTTKNARYGNLLPNVELELVNLCTGEQLTARSDADGRFDFGCVPCGCEFVIKGDKQFFAVGELLVSSLDYDCAAVACGDGKPLAATLALLPEMPGSAGAMAMGGKGGPDPIGRARTMRLKTGSVIELKNIYYDFDQYYIRPDAQPDLDHVVELMLAYPEMEIELGSHTDARGTESYNRSLAQNRATAARAYIIGRGISGARIEARGFGESRLRNGCRDSKDCSEEDHQRNRRTEVRVVAMGKDEGVEVVYRWE